MSAKTLALIILVLFGVLPVAASILSVVLFHDGR